MDFGRERRMGGRRDRDMERGKKDGVWDVGKVCRTEGGMDGL